jgi:hypothetical protein
METIIGEGSALFGDFGVFPSKDERRDQDNKRIDARFLSPVPTLTCLGALTASAVYLGNATCAS